MEPPKRLMERVFDFCVTVVVCAFLLRLAMGWLKEVAPYLLICAAVILAVIVGYRAWKYLHDMGKW